MNDLADAHVRALQYLEVGGERGAGQHGSYDKSGNSVALNLGTGCGHSVLEIVKAVERITGRAVPRHIGPRRRGDPPILVADPGKAQSVLGWTARRDLSDIVASAWSWTQKRALHAAAA